eukprot:snap_masked-scaffold_3-processed-gene-8.21-mRNA-1 protein AED:1.00 eAED:1.00 QI:0/0/0/0/1/1/2/0/188
MVFGQSALVLPENIDRIIWKLGDGKREILQGVAGEPGVLCSKHKPSDSAKLPMFYLHILTVDTDTKFVRIEESRGVDCDVTLFDVQVLKRPEKNDNVLELTMRVKMIGIENMGDQCIYVWFRVFGLFIWVVHDAIVDFQRRKFLIMIGFVLLNASRCAFIRNKEKMSLKKYFKAIKEILEANPGEHLV